ncbi:MAG: epoxide hydrolase [Armatimonadetes bacterium]|nr:epoxide hydrolase [Armatimonadota bacterium]
MNATPYKINVAQQVLDDLQTRLANTRWTSEMPGAGWDTGTNLEYLQSLTQYWHDGFDWRKQETTLNGFSQFHAAVDGLDIHFVHERGKGDSPMPLILLHGFPDSFVRFAKVIPLLTDPAAHGGDASDAFDVIVPSLPGYGFSERPTTPGVTMRVADMLTKLVTETLRYDRFAAAGGDIGSDIVQQMATTYPDRLTGIHLTGVPYRNYSMFLKTGDMSQLSEPEHGYLKAGQDWGMREGAYAMLQSTKPQTLAYGLNDSPVGLAAWIVEKFRAWSDCDGDVEKRFSKDELLTNITIYWATETINSAFRYYYEVAQSLPPPLPDPVVTPTGFTIFPKDITPAPREWAARFFGNITRWESAPSGGHFAAMEEPEWFVQEIRAFFRPLR